MRSLLLPFSHVRGEGNFSLWELYSHVSSLEPDALLLTGVQCLHHNTGTSIPAAYLLNLFRPLQNSYKTGKKKLVLWHDLKMKKKKKIYSLPFQQAALSLFNRQLCSYMGFPNCSFLEWGWSHLHQIAKKAPKANSPEAGKNCFDEKLSNSRGASKLQMAKVRWIIQGGRGNYPWG